MTVSARGEGSNTIDIDPDIRGGGRYGKTVRGDRDGKIAHLLTARASFDEPTDMIAHLLPRMSSLKK